MDKNYKFFYNKTMDNLKFILTLVIVSLVIGLGGYWAVASMQSGSDYVKNQQISKLESENEDLKKEVERLTKEIGTTLNKPEQKEQEVVVAEPKAEEKPKEPAKKPTTTTYKNQTLINELQKLADKGVVLEPKSTGPSVGSVQKFLNLYNKTSNKVDNDYGEGTKKAVMAFQKAEGLNPDGGVGKSTFTKMIAWLKKQG